jgi:Kef-type K+ transport system membrane component KefB
LVGPRAPRAGSFVSVPALIAAPVAFLALLAGKLLTKTMAVFPVTRIHREDRREMAYTTLLMSTGLTFGTISSLFGLSHGIITKAQYSLLVATVIGSAVIPTLIANAFYLPHHLIPGEDDVELETEEMGIGRWKTRPKKKKGIVGAST